MARLRFTLGPIDVDGAIIHDPQVVVRVGPPNGVGAIARATPMRGALVRFDEPDGPQGPGLILRVDATRYHTRAVTTTQDGNGVLTPKDTLKLPRRSSEWLPIFTKWSDLTERFRSLKTVLASSRAFRVGRLSPPGRFAEDAFDEVDVLDESRVLAKTALLNLYSRLADEVPPGESEPWFTQVEELLLATRERFVARVPDTCFDLVSRLARTKPSGYRSSNPAPHKKNFVFDDTIELMDIVSVKTNEEKANLQFTVARLRVAGALETRLDADIDENGRLLLHTFDLLRHMVTGGTHPIDIHECLKDSFASPDLGYQVGPRLLMPEVRTRIVDLPPP